MKNKLLRTIILMSKYSIIGIFAQLIIFSFVIASGSHAQSQIKSVKEVYVEVEFRNSRLHEVFSTIEQLTNYHFFFHNSDIEKAFRFDLSKQKISVEHLLLKISRDAGVSFKQLNENISVKKKQVRQDDGTEQLEIVIQGVTITGKVTSGEDDEGLPGVNVIVKGTSLGTVTDVEGNYALEVPDENAILVFSSVGYVQEEVLVGTQTVIGVTLIPDIKALEEIVVVGYGTTKKSDLTGSVSSVKSSDIKDLAMPSIDQALQGRAAGVFVTRNNGAPGSGAEIFIRGAGSIQGTDPLWIIDGVRTSPGTNFNMNDVESIEILKDASAASIYGAAAANGVIIITTKRGEKGKAKINFNAYAGVTTPLGLPEPLNTRQYAEIKNEAYDLAGTPRIPAYADPNDLPPVSTDWLDVLYGNGSIQNYDLSVSGGSNTSNFFVSGSYFNEEGTHVGTSFERFSMRANSDFKLGDRIKIGENILLSHARRDPQNAANTDWIRATPALPVYDASNIYGGFGTVDRLEYQYEGGNPLASELRTDEINKSNRVNGNVYAEVEILKGLSFKTNLGANFNFRNDRTFIDTYLGGGGVVRNTASVLHEYEETVRLLGNAVLTYEKEFKKHRVKALVGYEAIKTTIERYSASGANFTGSLEVINASDPNSRNANGSEFSDRILSQFGRVDYAYDDKYLFTANVRRDGSSLFGEDNRYGVFPSASVGWRLKQESFMEQATFISDLKLRASYGILGNSSGLGRYLYEASYTTAGTLYTFGDDQGVAQGLRPSRFQNSAIKWEEIETLNIGLDLGLLEDKLTFTADYYIKNTDDLLLTVGIPPSAGYLGRAWFTSPLNPVVNIGQIQNKGLEMAINYRNKIGDDFNYSISANASYNENEVLKLSEDERIVTGRWDGSGNVSVTEEGRPLGSFYGFIVDGIIQSQDELDALNNEAGDGFYQNANTGPGDFRYRDIGRFDEDGEFVADPDGEITNADQTFIGNPWPKWIYGINLNADFKNFDLNLFFQGVQGVDRFNSFKSLTHNLFGDYNMTTAALGRWTPENPNDEQPRIINEDPNRNRSTVSSYFVEDGSYLRLKNLQIGYTVPETVLKGVTKLRIYGSAQNLLTITSYEGFDPEFDRGGNSGKGIDRGGYPQSRIFTIGLQFVF